jgi:hypothetical protein
MSLTAHILFGKPTQLPKGRVRIHNPDTRRLMTNAPAREDVCARNTETRLANVEKVFNAIADGHRQIASIIKATSLSQCTVQRALHELEDWPGHARIKRIRNGHQPHEFEPLEKY